MEGQISPLYLALIQGNLEAVKNILAAVGIEKIELYERPLVHACRGGSLEVVRLLLDAGVDVNERIEAVCDMYETYGSYPLHEAAKGGHLEVVKLLVGAGADMHKVECKWNTPLHTAATAGHLDMVTYLVEAGADCCARNLLGDTPEGVAEKAGQREVAAYLSTFSVE